MSYTWLEAPPSKAKDAATVCRKSSVSMKIKQMEAFLKGPRTAPAFDPNQGYVDMTGGNAGESSWVYFTDASGKSFYYNERSGVSQWDEPEDYAGRTRTESTDTKESERVVAPTLVTERKATLSRNGTLGRRPRTRPAFSFSAKPDADTGIDAPKVTLVQASPASISPATTSPAPKKSSPKKSSPKKKASPKKAPSTKANNVAAVLATTAIVSIPDCVDAPPRMAVTTATITSPGRSTSTAELSRLKAALDEAVERGGRTEQDLYKERESSERMRRELHAQLDRARNNSSRLEDRVRELELAAGDVGTLRAEAEAADIEVNELRRRAARDEARLREAEAELKRLRQHASAAEESERTTAARKQRETDEGQEKFLGELRQAAAEIEQLKNRIAEDQTANKQLESRAVAAEAMQEELLRRLAAAEKSQQQSESRAETRGPGLEQVLHVRI